MSLYSLCWLTQVLVTRLSPATYCSAGCPGISNTQKYAAGEPGPRDPTQETFLAFARVFSGVIRDGQTLHVLSAAYNPSQPALERQELQVPLPACPCACRTLSPQAGFRRCLRQPGMLCAFLACIHTWQLRCRLVWTLPFTRYIIRFVMLVCALFFLAGSSPSIRG